MLDLLNAPVLGAFHLVSTIAEAITPALGELATAVAIILFTVAVRLLLHPLARAAARGDKVRAELAPQFQRLRDKHGYDQQRLREEVAKLQASSGSSFFTGCLPMLAQLPFFLVLYRLSAAAEIAGQRNTLLGHELFGAPLGGHFTSAAMPEQLVYFGLFALLGCVAWCAVRLQARISSAQRGDPSTAPPGAGLLRLIPYGTVLVAAFVPLAAGLYLLTTTTWTVFERAALRRPGAPGGPDPGTARGRTSTGH